MKFNVKPFRLPVFFDRLEKRQKILVAVVAALLVLDAVVIVVRLCLPNYSYAGFAVENSRYPVQRMVALNSSAGKTVLSENEYAFFRFTDAQQKQLTEFYEKNGTCSISVSAVVPAVSSRRYSSLMEKELPFYYGFLYASDFDKKGKFTAELKERTLSGTDLRQFVRQKTDGFASFDIGFALEKNLSVEALPAGLVIYASVPLKVTLVKAVSARVGFDYTQAVPYYGVPANGGAFGSASAVDFSGCSMVFPVQNSRYSVMPEIELAFFPEEKTALDENELSDRLKLNAGGEVLTVYRAHGVESVTIQTASLRFPFSRFEIHENAGAVSKLIMTSNPSRLVPEKSGEVLYPLRTDPGLLLGSKTASWRTPDYELYEWDRFSGILFFDTKNYDVQDDFFRRLAFYVEKIGYKGKILTDSELGDMHGYNAHDYSAESLASFFSAAERSGAQLNEKELLLCRILLANGLIERSEDGYRPLGGAIISISQDSAAWLRKSLCAHEIWHGLFFTDEDFRTMTAAVYYTIDEKSLDFIRGYWASQPGLGYDQSDIYLMHNEFMAYIMQQPLNSVASYFVHVANRGSVMKAMPDLCAYVRDTKGITFEDAAGIFDSYAADRWGLRCGRVSLVVR